MPDFGFLEMFVLVVTVIVLSALGLTSRAGALPALPPVLVLRRFRVSEAPPDGVFVDISGRPKGIVAWILGLLRLDDETRLQLTATSLSIRRASLRGQAVTVIPLDQVGSTLCGFRKPLGYLAVGLYFGISALFSLLSALLRAGEERTPFSRLSESPAMLFVSAVIGLLVAAAFMLAYFLQKQMVIAVGDNTAKGQNGLTFKPSVIEGVNVDINRVIRATELINRKMLAAQLDPATVAAKIPPPSAADQRAAQRAPARAVPRCAGCGAALEADSAFCSECGRSVEP